jgi:hypothetical protein
MRRLLLVFLAIMPQLLSAQTVATNTHTIRKGSIYFYWGWNRGWYSNSDIRFTGDDYDFTLKQLAARDRPVPFGFDPYFHPARFTIPQYNARIGYFINDRWEISFGVDHMKYVVQPNQTVSISGHIDDPQSAYHGLYADEEIILKDDLLKFEHTDGLNNLNLEIKRFNKISGTHKIKINVTKGFGLGVMVPRTNSYLLTKTRHDEFHLSGFALTSCLGINVTFKDRFFIQSEFKIGYINMPDITTTHSPADRAKQDFYYTQVNIVSGVFIHPRQKKRKA